MFRRSGSQENSQTCIYEQALRESYRESPTRRTTYGHWYPASYYGKRRTLKQQTNAIFKKNTRELDATI